MTNDQTLRETMWKRCPGDDWAAFDALPPAIRHRMHQHAYDAWAVNAAILWRWFRQKTASSARAERRRLRYLDECEALERAAFDAAHRARHGGAALPHVAARASVQRCVRGGGGRGAGAGAGAGRGRRRVCAARRNALPPRDAGRAGGCSCAIRAADQPAVSAARLAAGAAAPAALPDGSFAPAGGGLLPWPEHPLAVRRRAGPW